MTFEPGKTREASAGSAAVPLEADTVFDHDPSSAAVNLSLLLGGALGPSPDQQRSPEDKQRIAELTAKLNSLKLQVAHYQHYIVETFGPESDESNLVGGCWALVVQQYLGGKLPPDF